MSDNFIKEIKSFDANEYDCLSTANYNRIYTDIDSNTSVRSNYGREDYYYFNQNERIPSKQKRAIKACMDAYNKIGIVHHVIDLMSEFACQGIRLQHPNKTIERFYQNWFSKINGIERSERFLNYLYRCANVPVKKKMGRVTVRKEKEWKSTASALDNTDINRREIPVEYVFLNPLTVDLKDENKSIYTGKREYVLKIPKDFDIGVKSESIPLDPNVFNMYFYKKDDWAAWAYPMTYSILDDLAQYEKLKLADISALNGIISSVRLWRLGSLEYKIAPTKNGIAKLKNILAKIGTGSSADVIWGPELDFKESSTNAYQFLGMAKYEPALLAIYGGLGIPIALTGMSVGKNTTNNMVSLKTLIERLEYGRSILLSFWNNELKIIQRAMGFRFPATVVFDQMILGDEAAEKALLIQLIDRDIISPESVLERFDIQNDLEEVRIKNNMKKRGDKLPQKAGPFHNPQIYDALKIKLVENGQITPSQGDLELEDPKPGESKLEPITSSPNGQTTTKDSNNGRPKNSKDKKKRKQRVYKPTANASSFSVYKWANDAQELISKIINPAFLSVYNKKSVRGLTTAQKQELENVRYAILYKMEPFEKISDERVYNILNSRPILDESIISEANLAIAKYVEDFNTQPTIDDVRNIYSIIYSNKKDSSDGSI